LFGKSAATATAFALLIACSIAAVRPATAEPILPTASVQSAVQQRQPRIAQAGSSGGSVVPPQSAGKKDKSISSGPSSQEEGATPPATQAPAKSAKPRRAARAKAPASRCPNIAGVWSSWASGIMGKNDTVFGGDGSATHRSGIKGRWWCADGELHIEWPDGRPGVVTLSADGRTIYSSSGRVHMRRK
jgi:hypothetical protein